MELLHISQQRCWSMNHTACSKQLHYFRVNASVFLTDNILSFITDSQTQSYSYVKTHPYR